MPHIVQLSKIPVSPPEWLNIGHLDYEDELMSNIADHVSTDEAPQETIGYFLRCLTDVNPYIVENNEDNRRGFTLHDGYQEAYFRPAYASFLEYARKLANATTLDSFVKGSSDGDIFGLRESFHERFGWYVYFDTITITLDDFMRHYAETEVRYFIGGTVYYHT